MRHWQAPAEASLRAKEVVGQSHYGEGSLFYLLDPLYGPRSTPEPLKYRGNMQRGGRLWEQPHCDKVAKDAQVHLGLVQPSLTQAPDSASQAHQARPYPSLQSLESVAQLFLRLLILSAGRGW